MGHAWAMRPRLLCSAGGPIKAPACARARDSRVNEAGGRGARERRRRQRSRRAQQKKVRMNECGE
eukprot:4185975-Pyramimonas_sp.AAC.1